MPESFLVLFNSQGSNVINSSNINAVVYDVNWDSFLPRKYKKFQCQFIFKSQNYNGTLTSNGFVNMNLGKMNVYDGNTQTANIGIVYPVVVGNQSFYNSTNNDNNDFWISYPTNRQVTINLNNFNNTSVLANMQNYCLYLSLIGISDEEII